MTTSDDVFERTAGELDASLDALENVLVRSRRVVGNPNIAARCEISASTLDNLRLAIDVADEHEGVEHEHRLDALWPVFVFSYQLAGESNTQLHVSSAKRSLAARIFHRGDTTEDATSELDAHRTAVLTADTVFSTM